MGGVGLCGLVKGLTYSEVYPSKFVIPIQFYPLTIVTDILLFLLCSYYYYIQAGYCCGMRMIKNSC
jgi:hypothetical protein